MLRACEVNLRFAAYSILSSCILAVITHGSYFKLIKSSGQQTGEQGASSGTLLHKFFECDREPTCTHVIKRYGSEEYVVVHGEVALEKITNTRMIWKKMIINVVRGNIALGKPTTLSSLWRNDTSAALAVDGNKATTFQHCALSKSEENAWLRVDLQARAIVESISILSFEAGERTMKAIDVRAGDNFENGGVGNPPCQLNVTMPADSSIVHVKCPSGLKGRYITVDTQGTDYIEICELEVYGYYV